MQRYLLFGNGNYTYRGGWGDFIASADSVEDLKAIFLLTSENAGWDPGWYQIVDIENNEIVEEYGIG